MEAKRSCWPTWMVSPTNQPGGCLMVSEMLRSCIAFVVSSFQAVALLSNVAHIVWRSIKYASEVCCAVCVHTYILHYYYFTFKKGKPSGSISSFLLMSSARDGWRRSCWRSCCCCSPATKWCEGSNYALWYVLLHIPCLLEYYTDISTIHFSWPPRPTQKEEEKKKQNNNKRRHSF